MLMFQEELESASARSTVGRSRGLVVVQDAHVNAPALVIP